MKRVEIIDKMEVISKMTGQELLDMLGNRAEGIKEDDEMKTVEEELNNIIHESNILLSEIKEKRGVLELILGGGKNI